MLDQSTSPGDWRPTGVDAGPYVFAAPETIMRQHGPWQILSTREVYRDPWIEVDRDEVVRPDGLPGSHAVVRLKAGISVLALDDQGQVHLTEEFHYAVGRTTWEVVSGGIEPGEDPAAAAERELAEELGIRAGCWHDLGSLDPFTSVVVSPTRLFLAEQLTFGPPACEGTEQISRRVVALNDAVEQIAQGQITHGPTCVLLLQAFLRKSRAG